MVASGFVSILQSIWPFSMRKYDDLRESKELVGSLLVPESTKNFVFAIRVPEHDSVIYILSAQNLSERSARDAECLIKEVRPDAVVVQVDKSSMAETQNDGSGLGDSVPTSVSQVLKQCFMDKVNKEKYETAAGVLVLREIFGTSFNGHYLAAKRMAKEVGSSFMVLESPFVNISAMDCSSSEIEAGNKLQGLANSLLPQSSGSAVLSTSRRSFVTNEMQARMLKLLSSHINQLNKESDTTSLVNGESNEIQSLESYEVPSFAQSIYPLLVDLHDIFNDLPFIGRALANARKMLSDVNKGEAVDTKIISEIYIFQIAVEGLRIALNNAGRLPIKNMGRSSQSEVDFSKLSSEDKSYVLIADLLKNQAEKFKTVVAIVDASNLGGLRKHWNSYVPQEVKDMSGHVVAECDDDDDNTNNSKLSRLLSDKPVVAVGAGATAIWSASSLSKAIYASPFMKILTFKVPTSLNLFLTHTHKVMSLAFGKVMGPTKVMAPGFASSGAKSSSLLKASLSAEKIRAVTHSVIASVEKTSFSAMRSAFYEIMRRRQARPLRALPVATFGVSLATCTGLLVYGDGIECAAGSLPSAPSIANLGRGIQNLRKASEIVRQDEGNRIQNSIESLMQRLKKVKIQ